MTNMDKHLKKFSDASRVALQYDMQNEYTPQDVIDAWQYLHNTGYIKFLSPWHQYLYESVLMCELIEVQDNSNI